MAGGPSMDPWMSWIHRWPRTDPSPSLGPPEAANGLRGPWDLRRLPGPNSLFECYVRVARPWCCWGRGWFAWYLWRWCGSRHDKFRILKFYLARLFGLLRSFRFRFFLREDLHLYPARIYHKCSDRRQKRRTSKHRKRRNRRDEEKI